MWRKASLSEMPARFMSTPTRFRIVCEWAKPLSMISPSMKSA